MWQQCYFVDGLSDAAGYVSNVSYEFVELFMQDHLKLVYPSWPLPLLLCVQNAGSRKRNTLPIEHRIWEHETEQRTSSQAVVQSTFAIFFRSIIFSLDTTLQACTMRMPFDTAMSDVRVVHTALSSLH